MLEYLTHRDIQDVGSVLAQYYDNPFIVETLGKLRQSSLSAGLNNTFLLTATGQLYACGNNEYGQLGLGDKKNRSTFTLVPTPAPVLTVTAGYLHSFLLTTTGQLYTCGDNRDGQLGLGDKNDRSIFALVPTPAPVLAVVAGGFHTFLLTTSGQLYACGDNEDGQLGLGNKKTVLPSRPFLLLNQFSR